MKKMVRLKMVPKQLVFMAFLCLFIDSIATEVTVLQNDNSTTTGLSYDNIRLPKNVLPIEYTIYLHPNITDGKFHYTGDVEILLKITSPTDKIVVHTNSHSLTYIGVSEEESRRRPIKVVGTRKNKNNEYVIIKLKEKLSVKNRYLLRILFSARLSSGLSGFYKSSYTTKNGKVRYIATTDFEPTGARKAFPCFDEPAMKAKFTITIVREKQHSSLSNMPVAKKIVRQDGLIEDHFQKSVKMSSYLVAFVITDFAHLSTKTKRGIKIRVWAPPDLIEQAQYALEVTPKVIDYYEKFFKINFPLPKQDLIAIPDFESGAMENWGLITYRLTALLYDKKTSSSDRKQWVAMVIAHELAHQWFGNLVTMKWWSDLWLNEGFANFIESLGANIIGGKEWKVMDQFVNDNLHSSMELDSKYESHPISVTVKNPSEISELFDIISYNKGSSIIRMMRDFIGTDRFRNGLALYLEKYKYKNAASNDLWACLSKATNHSIDVKKVMDTWTLQMGYPVVNVRRDPKDDKSILVTQERFTSDVQKPNKTQKSGFHYKWEIPLTYYFENSREQVQSDWLHLNDEKPFRIPRDEKWNWLKVNANQIGFYRVNYDEEIWSALAKQLENDHQKLSVADRSNLLDDAFAMAYTGRLSQSQALDMTRYFTKELDYVPFVSGLSKLNSIGWLLRNRPGHKSYEKYVIQQITPIVTKLGWEDNGPTLDRLLRKYILSEAISHNMTDVVKKALDKYHTWMYKNISMPANLQSIVYTAGVEYGGVKEWNHMLKKYKSTINPAERDTFMYALTETSNPKILQHYLKSSLNEKLIRSQDTCSVIARIAKNKIGTRMAKDFVKKNWKRLFKKYNEHGRDMGRLVSVFEKGKTISDLHEAGEFLRNRELAAGKMSAKRALANIYSNMKWLDSNEKTVVQWFDDNV